MSKRYEMTYQRTGGDNHRTKHDVLSLRLKNHEYECYEIDKHETVVYLTYTNLIVVTGSDKVYHSCESKYYEKYQYRYMYRMC